MAEQPASLGCLAVVGATGSVGSAVCRAAQAAGREVLGIARTPSAGTADVPGLALDAATVRPAVLAEVFRSRNVTAVVNAAGGWGTTAEEMVSAHVRIPERIVAAGALRTAAGAPPLRVVHVGSVHEYGPVSEGAWIDESLTPDPRTPYATTKLAGSEAVLRGDREGSVRGLVLRAVNVCGPGTSRASFLGTVADRLRATAAGERLDLRIAPARRDYVDVRDLARAVLLAVESPVSGRAVNIGRGEAVAVGELVALLAEASGLPDGTVRASGGTVTSKGGDWTLADISLAQALLGWSPSIGLRASMADMWESTRPAEAMAE
ncbi:NAD(P)-dependent oxidoreductase [Streptomyces sp. S1A(2023)]